MVLNIFSVYDVVSDSYATPFFFINNSIAIRSFVQLCTVFIIIQEISSCVIIGHFDDIAGLLTALNILFILVRQPNIALLSAL